MNIAIFVSGNGSNLQALIDAERSGELSSGKISLVVSDKADAYALERAVKSDIPTYVQEPQKGESREDFDRKLSEKMNNNNIDLIVLAGFMRILSDAFVEEFSGRIINIHPALLPAFKGAHGVKDAFEYGTKITGVTVHFVDNVLDGGPIIAQKEVCVEENETLESLEAKIHKEEHRLYPKAVRLFIDGKLSIEGRIVNIIS